MTMNASNNYNPIIKLLVKKPIRKSVKLGTSQIAMALLEQLRT